MISIFAALNGSILSGSRVPFAMARDGLFVPAAAAIHPRYGTPARAIIIQAALASLLVVAGTLVPRVWRVLRGARAERAASRSQEPDRQA